MTPLGYRKELRLEGNALLLDDDYVSSEHALLAWREGRWWLSDVASTNGTFLNGQPVTRAVLREGDVLGIGRLSFTVTKDG